MDIDKIEKSIRNVPDFPKVGINFKDITTLLLDHYAFNEVINIFYETEFTNWKNLEFKSDEYYTSDNNNPAEGQVNEDVGLIKNS